jgi:hypothetical protein
MRIAITMPKMADYMYTDHVISPEEHAAWFSRCPQRSYSQVLDHCLLMVKM